MSSVNSEQSLKARSNENRSERAEELAEAAPAVGENLRRLRVQRGLSLHRLAKASTVSRAMLGQIELGQSTPTIHVLWRIARALDVPFSALLATPGEAPGAVVQRAEEAKVLTSHDGAFSSRALFPFDHPRRTEFYELRIAPGGAEHAEPQAPGTIENLVVSAGFATITVDGKRSHLQTGDSIFFQADVPHVYENPGTSEACLYLVMTYALDGR